MNIPPNIPPDGSWHSLDESWQLNGVIAVDRYEIGAGGALTASGVTPAILIRVSGVDAADVGAPDAPRREGTFLIRTKDVPGFSAQLFEASQLRPE